MHRQSFSVVIPTYGREAVLLETIRSLLAQEDGPEEIIIVDQTAQHQDTTEQQLRAWAGAGVLRWLREPIPNLPRARNVGTAAARGEVILFLDDDVLLPCGFLRRYRHAFSDARLAGACGLTIDEGKTPNSIKPLPCPAPEASRRVDLPLCNFRGRVRNPLHFVGANMAWRRDTILALGGFNEWLEGSALGEDLEFAGRARRAGMRTLYDSRLFLLHRRSATGGCRLIGAAAYSRQRDRMRNYYFALFHGVGLPDVLPILVRRYAGLARRHAPSATITKTGGSFPHGQAGQDGKVCSAAGRVVGAWSGILGALRNQRISGHLRHHYRPPDEMTIAIATYHREQPLQRTLQHLAALPMRESIPITVLLIDQTPKHQPETEAAIAQFARQAEKRGWHFRHIQEATPGASRARNIAAFYGRGVLLFLDDDISPQPGLLENHWRHYRDPDCTGVGGRILWPGEDPHAPKPFPGTPRAARRHPDAPVCYHTTPFHRALHVITCNFSVRRDSLVAADGFHEWFRGGGEDIELVQRLARGGGYIAYDPHAAVIHHVAGSGGTRHEGTAFARGYAKGMAQHFSNLRVGGLAGWTGVQWRRQTGLLLRAMGRLRKTPTPTRGITPPGPKRSMRCKLLEMLGSAAALPAAMLLAWRQRRTRGHYLRTAAQLRRRQQ